MGDRANIKINEERGGAIYFYTHCSGYCLPSILQDALNRGKSRWGDESYLNRIIFSEMIRESVEDTTGYGISTYETDNEYPIINVNHKDETVSCEGGTWTFQEYIELPDDSINAVVYDRAIVD